ncbi:HNH endonuclease [Paenibacillus sp. QZ-Y1]|uniref:HNH endonuclease n=1 Tax=Paenibacillus sp. QZ-Y1 TaxID=3414511 RepID=UPI003F7905F9
MFQLRNKLSFEDSHKVENNNEYKLCNICLQWFLCSTENFYSNPKNKSDGLYPYCKKCGIKKATSHINNNRANHNKNNLKYSKTKKGKENNRKISKKRRKLGYHKNWWNSIEGKKKLKGYGLKRKEKEHEITPKEWDDCRQYFNFRCAYCGKTWEQNKLETKKDLHKEHVVHEGKNDLRNCVPSCMVCNSSKHTASLNNWYNSELQVFSRERYLKIYNWLRYDHKKYIKEKIK